MPFTEEEKTIAINCARNGCDFMYIPSAGLCEKIVKGDPKAKGINTIITAVLLKRQSMRLDTNMVLKYCAGTLDKNNTWIFDNGDIKVVSPKFKLKENQEFKIKENKEESENNKYGNKEKSIKKNNSSKN